MSTDTSEASCRLRLYIVDSSPSSIHAKKQSRSLVSDAQPGRIDLEIIDVTKAPERAELDGIIATPTLMRVHPPPICRIFGDLSDSVVVLSALGLEPFIKE